MKNNLRPRVVGTLSAISLASLFFVTAASADVVLRDEPRPPGIMLQNTDDGVVFADKNGMTVYTAEFDQRRGQSKCTNEVHTHGMSVGGDIFALPNQDRRPTCLTQHPIVSAEGGKPVGPWSIIDRPDGMKQWAYEGKALYTSIKDVRPGDTNGFLDLQGVGRNQNATFRPLMAPAITPPEVRVGAIGAARVLVSSKDGRTLYMSAEDPAGKSKCEGACADTWHPILASTIAKEQGGWSVVRRADGSRQWAFKGKPLYTFERDAFPGDYNGVSEKGWDVAFARPFPQIPKAITVVHTILGPRYANAQGTTLYMFSCTEQGSPTACDNPQDRSLWWTATCGDVVKCADMWRPMLADENAKPVGTTWSLVTVQEPWAPTRAPEGTPGKKAWAYKGKLLFTFKYEDRPGMIEGEDMGILSGQKWSSIEADGYDITVPQEGSEVRAASR